MEVHSTHQAALELKCSPDAAAGGEDAGLVKQAL